MSSQTKKTPRRYKKFMEERLKNAIAKIKAGEISITQAAKH